MDDPVRGEEPKGGEEKKAGSQKPIAGPCFGPPAWPALPGGARGRDARQVLAGADLRSAGADVRRPAKTSPDNGGRRNGARTTRPAPPTTSRRPRCSTPRSGSRTARSTASAASTRRPCRCSAQRAFTLAHPRRADRRPVRRQQARLSRRVPGHRDRPDRHAVRRPRPYRHPDGQGRRQERDALLQRPHRAGDRRRLRPEEARHREAQAVLHPRPSVRHRRAQGRHDGRRPGDHGSPICARRCRSRTCRKRHQGRRRGLLQHRLGLAVDEEQRPVQQRRAGHRPGSRPSG